MDWEVEYLNLRNRFDTLQKRCEIAEKQAILRHGLALLTLCISACRTPSSVTTVAPAVPFPHVCRSSIINLRLRVPIVTDSSGVLRNEMSLIMIICCLNKSTTPCAMTHVHRERKMRAKFLIIAVLIAAVGMY